MRVDAGGVGIEYEVTGEGRPVVLLHGFPDSGRLWRHQVPALADAGFKVIVPDLRGYGRSDKPAEVEAYAMAGAGGRRGGGAARRRRAQGPRRRPRLGRGARVGVRRVRARSRRPPGGAVGRPSGDVPQGRLRAVPEVLVHAAVPVQGDRREVAVERRLGALPGVGQAPGRRRGDRRTRGERVADAGAELLPREHSARVVAQRRGGSCRRSRLRRWGCGARATWR